MVNFNLILLIVLLSKVFTIFCVTFEKNRNITSSLLATAKVGKSSLQRTILGCANFCADIGSSDTCNGFSYNKEDLACAKIDLNRISHLEDSLDSPLADVQVFTDLSMRGKLPLHCKGGHYTKILR